MRDLDTAGLVCGPHIIRIDLTRLSSRNQGESGYNWDMPNSEVPPPIIVNTQSSFKTAVNRLSRSTLVSVDTEANSLYAYREQVCLIQFSIPGTDYLVDPLALRDLSPLAGVFDNPKIEKIFHAAEYDLILLQRDFGFKFQKLFDTMIAARTLGLKSVGLRALLKSHFNVVVNKKYQRANWGRRPLPDEMLAYAQLDTHYLIPLRKELKSWLEAAGRWTLAEEDFQRACFVNANHHEPKGIDPWRINGVQDLTPNQVAVLYELCVFRDQKAQALDRPLFKVISDKALLNLAADRPDSYRKLERVPGITHKQIRWIGNELITAVQRGRNRKPPRQPRRERLDDGTLERVETLRNWRKITARKLGVESDIILPKDLLYALAEADPRTLDEIGVILQTVPYRLSKYGVEILDQLINLG